MEQINLLFIAKPESKNVSVSSQRGSGTLVFSEVLLSGFLVEDGTPIGGVNHTSCITYCYYLCLSI